MTIMILALVAAVITLAPDRNGNLPGLKPGAVVTLGPGPYDLIEIRGATFDPPVTIDAGTTVVRGLRIWDSKGVKWRGGVVQSPAGRDGGGPSYYGADLRKVDGVEFDGTRFTDALRGMVVADSRNIVVRNASFTGLRTDGIDLAGTSNVLLENNRFDNFTPKKATGSKADGTFKDGDHPDAIQMWTTPNVKSVSDITIRGNTIDGDTQGINFFGPQGDGYFRINISDNDVKITYPAAISLTTCTDCNVRENRLAARPESKFRPNIRSHQTTGAICGNIMPSTPDHPATAPC